METILKNLKSLIGKKLDKNEIICAFEGVNDEVIVNKSNNIGHNYVAYVNSETSEQYLFMVNNDNVITDVWMVG